jgi:hypothetical protein
MVMNVKSIIRLIEKSNLPRETKIRLRARLQDALDNYMNGRISQDTLLNIVTDILRQLNVDMSMRVKKMKPVEDTEPPGDETPPDDQVVEIKDEVIEEDYIGSKKVRKSWMI